MVGWAGAVVFRGRGLGLAGVEASAELRRDRPLPSGPHTAALYLDSFDFLRKVKGTLAEAERALERVPRDSFVEVCRQLSLPLNVAKSLVGAQSASLLGGDINGETGLYGLGPARQVLLLAGGLRLAAEPVPSLEEVRAGSATPALGLLSEGWRWPY